MPAKKRASSIRARLALAFLVVSSAMACLTATAVVVQWRVAEHATLVEAENVANAMAYTGVSDVLNKPAFLQRYVDGWSATYGRDLTIVDTAKRIVADSAKEEIGHIFDGDHHDEVAETIKHGRVTTFVERNERHAESLSLMAVPLRRNHADLKSPVVGAVILEYTPIRRELIGLVKPYGYALAGAGLLGVLLSGIWGLVVASRTAQPIEELQRGVHAIANGQYGAKVELKSSDEIAALGNAFNDMSAQLGPTSR